MFVLGTLLAGLAILALWAGILWVGARIDKPHLEKERLERVFSENKKNG